MVIVLAGYGRVAGAGFGRGRPCLLAGSGFAAVPLRFAGAELVVLGFGVAALA